MALVSQKDQDELERIITMIPNPLGIRDKYTFYKAHVILKQAREDLSALWHGNDSVGVEKSREEPNVSES